MTVTPRPRRAPGQPVQYQPVDRPADADLAVRMPVTAGPHVVGAAFVEQHPGLVERHRQPFLKVHITVGGDQRTQPNVYSISVTGPFDASGPGDTPSRRRIFTCRPDTTPATEITCATQILSTLARRAYRRPVTAADVALLVGLLPAGQGQRGLRVRHRDGAPSPAGQPGVPAAGRARSGEPRLGRAVSRERSGAGLPALVLPLEQPPGRRADRGGGRRDAESSGGAGIPRTAHAGRPACGVAGHQLRGAVALPAQSPRGLTRLHRVPGLRRDPAAGVAPGDGAVLREHRARGPRRAGSADRRLHVRERAAGEALRHPGHLRQPLPAHHAAAGQPPRRPSGSGQHPGRHRVRHAPRRRWSAANGFSRTSWERRRRPRRPTCRR